MRGLSVGIRALAATGIVMAVAGEVRADPALRVQLTQRGGFLLIGKPLGHDCNQPKPVGANLGACGMNALEDTGIDVYWRADSPGPGQIEGNDGITAAQARTAAIFKQPAGSVVTHAFLYWGAVRDGGGTDPVVTFDRQGGFTAQVDAGMNCLSDPLRFQCSADVTAIVVQNGSGQYRVGGVDAAVLKDKLDNGAFAAWYMIVLYQQPDEPIRNLAVFDGFDVIELNTSKDLLLDGFLVPEAAKDGLLGVVVYEGDTFNGDALFFNGGAALSSNNNPADNFFNGTHTIKGTAITTPGDLPRTSGTPGTLSGLDLDVVDISGKLSPGQTSAQVKTSTVGDGYLLAAFVTQITDLRPEFSKSVLTALDVDGGGLVAGDELEYVVMAVNSGNDDAVDVIVSHKLPAGVTYVGGSLEVVSGDNKGALSDVEGDDPGEFDAKTGTVVVRLGAGADAVDGGGLAIGSSSAFKFRVEIDANTLGAVATQAFISAGGAAGASPFPTATDDDGVGFGEPTLVYVGACESADDCGGGQCLGGVCGTPGARADADWATYAGKAGGETEAAVAVDGAGNVYLAGTAVSTSALATPGTHLPSYAGGASDGFLVKFAPDGARVWGTYIGGTGADRVLDVAVDAAGDVLVAGLTASGDGVASQGALAAALQGVNDGFVAQFTPAGARVWSTYLGSAAAGTESGQGVAFGPGGAAHVVGVVTGAFPFVLPGPHDTSPNGGADGYWLELDAAGGLVRGTYYGGAGADEAREVSVDAASVHITGVTGSAADIATPGAYDETLDGASDGWLARFQPTGARVWGTYLGGPGIDAGLGVQRLGGGVAVSGTTNSATGIASPGAFQPELGGASDAMVYRFDDLGARVWSTYYGGSADETTAALARDGQDNLLLAGRTASTAGIASADGLRSVAQGATDGFLVKLDLDGQRRWATYYGGAADEIVSSHGVAARGADDIYLAGRTGSLAGVATVDALFQPNFGGATDLFLAHLGQDLGDTCAQADECESLQCVDGVCCEQVCGGTCDVCSVAAGGTVDGTCALLPVDECAGTLPTLDWSTYAGASGAETRGSTAVDGSGFLYLVGTTSSTSGISTGGTHQFVYGGGADDVFVLKFSPTGDRIWGTYLGGQASDSSTGIAVDALGRVLVVGTTLSTNGIASPDGLQTVGAGGREGFAVLLDPEGQRLWGTYLGSDGATGDAAYAAAFDEAGDIYVAGDVQGGFPFGLPMAHDDTPGGATDAYLLALTQDGALQWGTYYGAAPGDAGRGVVVDDLGLVYLVGHTASPTDIATPGAFDETLDGPSDGFIAAFDGDGARQWGTYLGGDGTETGAGGAVTVGGVVFVGTTDSPGQATPGAHQAEFGGGEDALVVQFDQDGGRTWATYYGGAGDDQGAAISGNAAGSLLLTGTTTSSAGIASAAALQPDPLGGRDIFVAKLDANGGRRWGTYFGGQADDTAGVYGVATYGADVTYIAGHTASSVGVATPDALFQPDFKGMSDLFLARLSHGQGDTCSADAECDTGFCVDGVCCDAACGGDPGDCQACSVALGGSADGTCAPVADATACAAGVCMNGACVPDETSDSDPTAPTEGGSDPGTTGGTGNSDSNSGGGDTDPDPTVPTGGGPGGSGGPGGDPDESGGGEGGDTVGATDGGCGCAATPVPGDMSLGLLALLALRRRRRA